MRIRVIFFKICLLIIILNFINTKFYPQECQKSCAKAGCEMVSNPPCTPTSPNFDQKTSIGEMKCKQCTQSKETKCLKENLKKNFAIGGTNVTAVYCNDEYLVIWSLGLPHHETHLEYIPRPPGGTDLPYEQSCVGRSFTKQHYTFKIPLKTSLLSESQKNSLPGWPNNEVPLAGPLGIALNGVPIFPPLDDVNKYVWEICEVENCNGHVGRGADYHYHGDPYGSRCLYSATAEENNHPTIYGYSLDGVSIYGRYTKESQDNQSLPLDRCGGHSHGSYGYHYHSEVDSTGDFVKYMQGPSGCWRGEISKIANFWDNSGRQANYDNSKSPNRYKVSERNDYESLRPCCGSTDFYVTGDTKLNLIEGIVTAAESVSQAPISDSAAGPSNLINSVNTINYSFTTGNINSYMCAQKGIDIVNANLACAQADSGVSNTNGQNELKCASDGVILCFAFASLGKTGGSCAGDAFKEDGNLNTDVVYLPSEVAQNAIGKNSFSFSLTQTTVNGVASGFPSQGPLPKLKVLAMCSTSISSGQQSGGKTGNLQNTVDKALKIDLHYLLLILGLLFFDLM